MKIAIIASGIIKCYSTLEYLSKLNFEGATFKVFRISAMTSWEI